MPSAAENPRITVDDYLAGEQASAVKHDYVAGEVFAMAGAGEAHVTVALNLATLLRSHVRGGPCRVYISDMKVHVEKADAFYYPDVFVTCDPADSRENLFKRSPTLVVEVLSDSTAAFDRGAKFAHYRQIDSLKEYVLIEPERRSVDVFRRNADGNWVLHPFAAGEELVLASLDFRCPIDAVYEDVELP
jgi:Uma2 family endonuclease